MHTGGHLVETWAESYDPVETETVVTYDGGPLAGQATVTRNGNAWSIGAWSAPLIVDLLERVPSKAGIVTARLPEGSRVSHRGNTEIWMNFAPTDVVLPDGSTLGPVSFQFCDNA